MEAKAFISHTDGGLGASQLIKKRLAETDLNMEAFFSKDDIKPGEHIPERILGAMGEADICFMVMELGAIGSAWMPWEYRFCKDRGIRTIPVVYKAFRPNLRRVSWLNPAIKYMVHKSRQDLMGSVWNVINESREELELRAQSRNMIKIDAGADKTECSTGSTITISGSAKGPQTGTAHVHYLAGGASGSMYSERIRNLRLGADGSFRFKLRPSKVARVNTDRIFVEIRFGVKSQLIPIVITNGATMEPEPDLPDAAAPKSKSLSESIEDLDSRYLFMEYLKGAEFGTDLPDAAAPKSKSLSESIEDLDSRYLFMEYLKGAEFGTDLSDAAAPKSKSLSESIEDLDSRYLFMEYLKGAEFGTDLSDAAAPKKSASE